MNNKPFYIDYNATTPIDPEVIDEMLPYLREHFGNPSSTHWFGNQARQAVELARMRVADCIGCGPNEVIFTSGGSESNNFAIKGICYGNRHRGNHIITSTIEHPSVLQPCRYLETQGFEVTYLGVDEYGMVSLDELRDAVRKETILITIMHSNNEVGTIEPIAEIGLFAKEMGIYFHSDAAQSIGKVPVSVDDLAVDLLTIVGHKFYAPKGVGALYIREGTEIDPLIHGAAHEFGLRAGTEAVASIVALGKACEMAKDSLGTIPPRLLRLRERLFELLITELSTIQLNGHPASRLPNTLNIAFPGVLAGDLLAAIPEVAASPGSACHAESCEISPVLKAMGVAESHALGSIRFSFGKWNEEPEIDEVADLLIARYQTLLEGHRH